MFDQFDIELEKTKKKFLESSELPDGSQEAVNGMNYFGGKTCGLQMGKAIAEGMRFENFLRSYHRSTN